MSAQTRFCGVILAAGASSRMGRDKALLPWPPKSPSDTLLSAAICALKPFAENIIVVAGSNADSLVPVTAALNAVLVRNPAPERGQFSSIQTGLRAALDYGYNAAMITPVDCPPLSSASLQNLIATFEQAIARGAWAVAPQNNNRRGHPLLVARPLIHAFLNAPVTGSAREVKHAHIEKFEYVAVPDPLLTMDLNTPEEYARAAELAPKNA
jgi:molybdenum cofactor cytidylyltransferase